MDEGTRPGRARLAGRILFWYAIIFVVVIAVFGFAVTSAVRPVLERQVLAGMEQAARLLAAQLDGGVELDAGQVGEAVGARVTLIAADGTVLADSVVDPATMGNHAGRPEVASAMSGEVGKGRRESATTGAGSLYVAVATAARDVVVRLSVTEQQVAADATVIGSRVLAVASVIGVVGLLAVWMVAERMARPIHELTELAGSVASGRLEIRPRRSSLAELDRLGLAIGGMASDLGRRIVAGEEERRTLETVMAAMPQALVLVDGDEISYSNPTCARLLGRVPDRASMLVPRGLYRLQRDARAEGAPLTSDIEHGVPPRTLRATATPFGGDDRVLLVIENVTEQVRLAAIRQDFVADASHELKTPIAAMLASAEALNLALERRPERAREFADRVEESARRLSRIVADLLDLSRLEVSEMPDEMVDLTDVVEREVAAASGAARRVGLVLAAEIREATVRGSASDLALAVRNLCDNAIRYTDGGGAVNVSLWSDGQHAVLEVADTGAGIPTRALPRVFERFFRVDDARSRATGGTGLGLSIVRHVVERHGGHVSVESQLGVGSTFRVRLPAAGAAGDTTPVEPGTGHGETG